MNANFPPNKSYHRASSSSDTSYSQSSNNLDFSYLGLDNNARNDDDTISRSSSIASASTSPTSLLFDLESRTPHDMVEMAPHHYQGNNKPLPLSPTLSLPLPVARPIQPRKSHRASRVLAMRSRKMRYEPRNVSPMSCIPESQSPLSFRGRRSGNSSSCRSSPGPQQDPVHGRSNMHSPARGTIPPQMPASIDPVAANIAPWDACPCPGGKTYSYEIVGGPRALHDTTSNSLSRREKARKESERQRRALKWEEERRDHERRQRPNGPREMG